LEKKNMNQHIVVDSVIKWEEECFLLFLIFIEKPEALTFCTFQYIMKIYHEPFFSFLITKKKTKKSRVSYGKISIMHIKFHTKSISFYRMNFLLFHPLSAILTLGMNNFDTLSRKASTSIAQVHRLSYELI